MIITKMNARLFEVLGAPGGGSANHASDALIVRGSERSPTLTHPIIVVGPEAVAREVRLPEGIGVRARGRGLAIAQLRWPERG
jgi:hypothetical protein